MKKLIALLLISAVVLSAVTFQEAWDEASKYKLANENLDIKPAQQTVTGGTEYWVFEVYSYGKLKTMVPINAETGLSS